MRYFPVFLDLKGKRCIVIGGGEVAERKVHLLLKASAEVMVISPALTEGLQALKNRGEIEHLQRPYRDGDLEGAFLVVVATSQQQVNRLASEEAHRRGIPVNVVDAPELCSFIVPSILQKGPLTIAISTSGESPAMARTLREELEEALPPALGEFISYIGKRRSEILKSRLSPEKKADLLRRMVDRKGLRVLRDSGLQEAIRYIEAVMGEEIENR